MPLSKCSPNSFSMDLILWHVVTRHLKGGAYQVDGFLGWDYHSHKHIHFSGEDKQPRQIKARRGLILLRILLYLVREQCNLMTNVTLLEDFWNFSQYLYSLRPNLLLKCLTFVCRLSVQLRKYLKTFNTQSKIECNTINWSGSQGLL